MRTFIILFLFLLFTERSSAQEVDIFSGAHLMEHESGQAWKDGGKMTTGFAVRDVYRGFGFYCNFYSDKIKLYGDTIVVHSLTEHRFTLYDSATYDINVMPCGPTLGLNYIFPFRLGVYAGAGMARERVKRMEYHNLYFPSSTGWYDHLVESHYRESVQEVKHRFMFELGVEYDVLPSPLWTLGVRAGYNSAMKFSGQVMVGVNLGEMKR